MKRASLNNALFNRFLRCQKTYTPPTDLNDRLEALFEKTVAMPADSNEPILNPSLRYSLFAACFTEFNHGIPNSILHTIKTYGKYDIF